MCPPILEICIFVLYIIQKVRTRYIATKRSTSHVVVEYDLLGYSQRGSPASTSLFNSVKSPFSGSVNSEEASYSSWTVGVKTAELSAKSLVK